MTNNYRHHQKIELQLLIQREEDLKPKHRSLEMRMITKRRELETIQRALKEKEIEVDNATEEFRETHSEMSDIRMRRGEIENEFFRFPEDQYDWRDYQ